MLLSQEQFLSASKAQVEAQVAYFESLRNGFFDNLNKLSELNMTTAKTMMEESSTNARALIGVQTPQDLFVLVKNQTKQFPDQAVAYSRQFGNILSGLHSDINAKTDHQVSSQSRNLSSFVEEMGKKLPERSESVISAVKSAIDNSHSNYEKFSRTTKQAVDAMERNFNIASAQLVENVAAGKEEEEAVSTPS